MSTSSTGGVPLVPLLLLAALQQAICGAADLKYGFYDKTCPVAEALVQKVVDEAYSKDCRVAPGLVRLHSHDCFVRGCDGSVLIDTTPDNTAEKDAVPNKSLRGFEVIDSAKAAVEAACPGVVSCADILAFAAREGAALAGDIVYDVPAGRRDGTISSATEAVLSIPSPTYDSAQLIESFAARGLTPDDLVTLAGAHSFGVAHCTAFIGRLYNYSSACQTDPALSPAYAELLRKACPPICTEETSPAVWLDLVTPDVLDNKWYAGLQLGLGLLTSDQALMAYPPLSAVVGEYARSPAGWAAEFGRAMVKMGSIQVLTGREGEIRADCRVLNRRRPRPEASS